MELWLWGFIALLALILIGAPVAFAMALIGVVGCASYIGFEPALRMAAQLTYETGLSYEFSVIPLFILMGNFITRSGISDELYAAANAWLGHKKGGLAMATIAASAGFSAVCGSSVATAATMTKVAMKPMLKQGYDPALATGSIAAGGTLGILIPPSVALVLYGFLTQTDVGKLFIAGILPGLFGVFMYIVAVWAVCKVRPEMGPEGPTHTFSERLRAMKGVGPILVLFLFVIGGIYFGAFTATEAAGMGAAGAFLIAMSRGTFNLKALKEVLVESGSTTAMIFIIVIGALMFSNFINLAGLPYQIIAWVESLDTTPMMVLLIIMAIYLVLGCMLESISMILLTVPIFFPLVDSVGIDLIWFGILVVVVTEISLISPPLGMNVFVMRSLLPDVSTVTIYRGVMPFVVADVFRLGAVLLLPAMSLWLPALMR